LRREKKKTEAIDFHYECGGRNCLAREIPIGLPVGRYGWGTYDLRGKRGVLRKNDEWRVHWSDVLPASERGGVGGKKI